MSTAVVLGPVLSETVSADLHFAVDKMFVQMFNVSPKSNFKVIEREALPAGDVTGIIGLNQKHSMANLIIVMPRQTVFALLKNLYGREFSEVDKLATGLVGEVTNIVYGVLKTRLNEKGFTLGGFGIPQIFAGAKPNVPKDAWILCGNFTSDVGGFHAIVARA